LKYRAEIDGLRALSVIPVILFHAGFELFSGGFVGVDVFFQWLSDNNNPY
jgi:peptidoglycan/LPS O-acetylase OafA/YrhL